MVEKQCTTMRQRKRRDKGGAELVADFIERESACL